MPCSSGSIVAVVIPSGIEEPRFDECREVLRLGLAGSLCFLSDARQNDRGAAGIDPLLPGRMRQGLRARETGHIGLQVQHAGDIRYRAVRLVPLQTARHGEQVLDANLLAPVAGPARMRLEPATSLPSLMSMPMTPAITVLVMDQPSSGVLDAKPGA